MDIALNDRADAHAENFTYYTDTVNSHLLIKNVSHEGLKLKFTSR